MYVEKYGQYTISKEIIDFKLGDVSNKMLLVFLISKVYVESLRFFRLLLSVKRTEMLAKCRNQSANAFQTS